MSGTQQMFMVASRSVPGQENIYRLSQGDAESHVLTSSLHATQGLLPQEVRFRMWGAGRPWHDHSVVMTLAEEQRIKELFGVESVVAWLLDPKIIAVFRPEVWQGDYAVEIDGRESFDVLPALMKMTFSELRNLLLADVEYDELADGLAARENHNGPFEVEFPPAAVVPLAVMLLLGRPIGRDDFDFSAGDDLQAVLDEPLWDRFRAVAAEVCALRNALRGTPEEEEAPADEAERLTAEVARLQGELERARGVVSILYGALNDASLVVDASRDEEYAYQAELESAREFLGIDTDPRPAQRQRSAP